MSNITISPGANIQNVINSAASGTTIVFTPGVYNVSQVIDLKSGVSLQGQAGAQLLSNGNVGIFEGHGVHNINISGFTFDGHNGGPEGSGAIHLDSSTGGGSGTPSNAIHISNNTFQNWTNNTGANLRLWHTQDTYVEGNTFKNGWEAVAWSTDSNAPPMENLVVSNNVITGMEYIGIETAFDSTVSDVHIDYNKISNIGDMSISFVEGEVGARVLSSTVWGNEIDGANSGGTPVELGNHAGYPLNVTVSQNVLSNHEWGMMFSHTDGMAVFDNTFSNIKNPFPDDKGYDRWIGTNTVNGAKQTGVEVAGDTAVESAGEGTDLVAAVVNFTPGDNVENLILKDSGDINGTGNGLDNRLTGNTGANALSGLVGDDTILGLDGDDMLLGGDGDDVLIGGAGRDVMTGGAGADRHVFQATSDSAIGAARDVITDFLVGADKIDVMQIDANTGAAGDQAFTFIGTEQFMHQAGELQATLAGDNTMIAGDVDGNGGADFQILVGGHVELQATDFWL